MSSLHDRSRERGQLTGLGIVIGCIGCSILTASSVYTALKMGALPWPTFFTSITALVILRACGHNSLNEANVTQIIMSAGSMVAGGLAFTIPGSWMLGLADQTSWLEMLFVALAGTLMGLVCTALIRRRFIEESQLEYPIGTAAAQTLKAQHVGGITGKRLFGSMAFSGIWCVLRDVCGVLPAMLGALPIPGISFGIYNSPMMLSLGFLVGGGAILAWFIGAAIGNFGIIVGGSAVGLWDLPTAQAIVSSLGMGLMMGSGLGVVMKDVIPHLAQLLWGTARHARQKAGENAATSDTSVRDIRGYVDGGMLAFLAAAAALIACFGLGFDPLVTLSVVLLSFVTTIMSAQSVGQTGIDPMEIFGLIVLLFVAAFSHMPEVKLFYVAGIVAVACGLAGDVMSDFKTGALIGTNPRVMWTGQAIGALIGAVVAVITLYALGAAYGPDAFGPGKEFVAAQASVVATTISGIPSVPACAYGLVAGIVLYFLGLPSMMVGLGVYLPFYLSLTGSLGALINYGVAKLARARGVSAQVEQETGVVVASGLLGGESIVGVLIALASVVGGLLA